MIYPPQSKPKDTKNVTTLSSKQTAIQKLFSSAVNDFSSRKIPRNVIYILNLKVPQLFLSQRWRGSFNHDVGHARFVKITCRPHYTQGEPINLTFK